MIVSASRRTDIPAFYAEWFFDKLDKGMFTVRNPMNRNQIRVIECNPQTVDCFVFWTKNPKPFMPYMKKLDDYRYYFQYTLNPYDSRIEKNLPDFREKIMIFRELSGRLDRREQLVWRYDPILMCENMGINVKYHTEMFRVLLEQFSGATDTCIISFLDIYQKNRKRLLMQGIRPPEREETEEILFSFSESIKGYDMSLQTCCEGVDFNKYGVKKGACIDGKRVENLAGHCIDAKSHKGQRKQCGCVESVDIGSYDTCLHGCSYCYACR